MLFEHYQPTALDVFKNEHAMCQSFWKKISQLHLYGKIGEFDIFHVSNNQAGGDRAALIRQARDKSVGVVASVADYRVDSVNGYLEAKIYKYGKPRKDGSRGITKTTMNDGQKKFRQHCLVNGIKHEVFYTPAQGIAILKKWGAIKD